MYISIGLLTLLLIFFVILGLFLLSLEINFGKSIKYQEAADLEIPPGGLALIWEQTKEQVKASVNVFRKLLLSEPNQIGLSVPIFSCLNPDLRNLFGDDQAKNAVPRETMEMMGIVSTELDNKSNPQTFLTEFPRREHIDFSGSFQTTLLHALRDCHWLVDLESHFQWRRWRWT